MLPTPEQGSLCSDLFFCLRLKNKSPAHSFLTSCGTRLCLRRVIRLASYKPRRHLLLAVPAAGGAHRRCPFPQNKITLGSPARPEAPSRRFCCRCQLLRVLVYFKTFRRQLFCYLYTLNQAIQSLLRFFYLNLNVLKPLPALLRQLDQAVTLT